MNCSRNGLPTKAERVSLRIEDIEGKVVRELRGETAAGLHRLHWDLGQQVTAVQRGGATGVGGPILDSTPSTVPARPPQLQEPGAITAAQSLPAATGDHEAPSERRRGGPPGGPGGAGPGGPGGRGGSRPAPNGTYRAILVVDGKEMPPQTIALLRDPMASEDAISEEEAEQAIIDEKRAADAKRAAKSEGRQLYNDN